MLESIIDMVKKEVSDVVLGQSDVPADKRDQVVETTTSALVNNMKDHFIPDNLSDLTKLFTGGSSGTSTTGSSMASSLQSSVVSALSEKLGLNSSTANTIAAAVIPAVMSLFTKKVNDSNEPGFNIGSLIQSFTSGDGSGILGALGKLFGK